MRIIVSLIYASLLAEVASRNVANSHSAYNDRKHITIIKLIKRHKGQDLHLGLIVRYSTIVYVHYTYTDSVLYLQTQQGTASDANNQINDIINSRSRDIKG